MYGPLRLRLRRGDHRVARLTGILLVAVVVLSCGGRAGGTASPTSPIARRGDDSSSPHPTGRSAAPASSAVVAATTSPTASPTAKPVSSSSSGTPSFWTEDATSRDDDHQNATYLQLTVTDARWGALAIQTAPNTSCVAGGQYPSGTQIIAAGLGQKRANGSGGVSWSFQQTPAEHGSAIYALTCSEGQSMRTVRIHFLIA
ncbi:MAG TPA: hypothetical protein VHG53_01860 [Candidatus Limnocylindria bacterium]|nr:hypothetical protein [Candidatus Limnocylindria bacterium]